MLYGSKIVLCLLLIPKTLYYVDLFNSFLVDFNFKVTGFIFVFSFKNSKVCLLIFQRKFFFFFALCQFVSSTKVEMIH